MKRVILSCATFALGLGLVVAAPAALAGGTCDFDGDGVCGSADRVILMSLRGSARGDANYRADVDLDGDGVISLADAALFLQLLGAE